MRRAALPLLALLLGWALARVPAPPPATARALEGGFADLVARANPSVVHVAIRQQDGARGASRDDGVGGGFVVAGGGIVVTSRHVVSGARGVIVQAPGTGPLEARLLGVDDATDVAVLSVPALADRVPLPRADPRGLRVGDIVLAAGSPFALPNSWSLGLVSGLGRSGVGVNPRGYESFIQTDAAANLGSSGGPLLDTSGRVVGVMTAILSRTSAHQGVSLAMPIDVVMDAVGRITGTGRAGTRPTLGLSLRPAPGGLVVTRVESGGAAERQGLLPGDFLQEAGGVRLGTAADLQAALWDVPQGGSLVLTLVRGGRTVVLHLLPDR